MIMNTLWQGYGWLSLLQVFIGFHVSLSWLAVKCNWIASHVDWRRRGVGCGRWAPACPMFLAVWGLRTGEEGRYPGAQIKYCRCYSANNYNICIFDFNHADGAWTYRQPLIIIQMQALVLNSSGRTQQSVSRQLVAELVEQLQRVSPDLRVAYRDVAAGLPFVDDEMIGSYFTFEANRTPAQKQAVALSDELIAELKAADVLVVGMPIYNFGMPACLKAYVDLVCRVGLTFEFTAAGPAGLLHGKKAYLVVASGSSEVGTTYDMATPHLQLVLGFMGITDVEIINADQLSVLGEATVTNARAAIQAIGAELV